MTDHDGPIPGSPPRIAALIGSGAQVLESTRAGLYVSDNRRYESHADLVTADGQPVEFFLTPGSFSDVGCLEDFDLDLPASSILYADRGYTAYAFEDALQELAQIEFQPMRKKNAQRQFPAWIQYLQHHFRKRIETTGSLLERLLPKSIHAVTAVGFELKVVLFVLAVSINGL